ncbi:GAF domain-containing protein [Chitinivorax sp. PXF-14]|uniref:GAF domain-containing protein n=1 Tax=Chitinivorax sp. PXF-14 TaxID=3230488 RepID=UPI00346682A3
MQAPSLPSNEQERISTLRSLLILDTEPEQYFDNLTNMAAGFFNVPIALVSLVDANRQWFKSRCGLTASETSREISFCGHAILSATPLVIEDTLTDDRFADNPLVTGPPRIRFYAGAPLRMDNGVAIGTFCIIDSAPRHLDAMEITMLTDLAKLVVQELQSHRPIV